MSFHVLSTKPALLVDAWHCLEVGGCACRLIFGHSLYNEHWCALPYVGQTKLFLIHFTKCGKSYTKSKKHCPGDLGAPVCGQLSPLFHTCQMNFTCFSSMLPCHMSQNRREAQDSCIMWLTQKLFCLVCALMLLCDASTLIVWGHFPLESWNITTNP